MTQNLINQVPYLRTTRDFPEEDIHQLTIEINKMYIDVAASVNNRIIGLFPTTRSAITGESWYLKNNQRQQSIRQVYTFTTFSSIAHGIKLSEIAGFTKMIGSFTDGNLWYPLPYVSSTAANQVGVSIGATNIIFDAGGSAPSITSGLIVLDWLSQA